MSAAAVTNRIGRTFGFWQATLGKKAIMAVTGVILFGFLIGHMLGNLQVFAGREKINAYAAFLHHQPGLLWGTRLILLAAVTLHIVATVQLWLLKREARPVAYKMRKATGSSYASRTMYWSGPIIAAFVVYHLLHFTFGTVHPNFQEGDVYDNLVSGFRVIPVSIAYIVAMGMICLHLYHGLWSWFQTLGVSHPRYTPWLQRLAIFGAFFIFLGFAAVPVAVLAGVVG
jgi:succinate dehydrogenase / fumarate reductase cytochrome b subunit